MESYGKFKQQKAQQKAAEAEERRAKRREKFKRQQERVVLAANTKTRILKAKGAFIFFLLPLPRTSSRPLPPWRSARRALLV